MASDEDIIVSCTNADCLLRLRTTPVDLATFMDLYPGRSIPTHVEALATHAAVPCPACESEGRDGTLVYIDDYLRRSPPNKESLIPALREAGLRGADTVWKKVEQVGTAFEEALPDELRGGAPLGIALEVRPYGGYVLRHGNSDHERQYGDEPPGASGPKGGYVRELKHDLLYMAYFGDRERGPSEELGGAGVFEAMTVGAILALKLDLWFFYGVPITSDLEASTISDEQLRSITLETFEGPIYFDLWAIGDNPVEPIYLRVILPVGAAVKGLGVALQKIAEGYGAYVEVLDEVNVSAKRRVALRKRTRRRLNEAMEWLEPGGPGEITLPSTADVVGARIDRDIEAIIAHPCFAQTKHKPWATFEAHLRSAVGLSQLRDGSHRELLQRVIDGEQGRGTLAQAAKGVLARYERYVAAAEALDPAALTDVAQLVGGLPETFEPYLTALREQAVVDHGTALYIKAVMAGVKIGSDAGKVPHAGRKLVYRTAEGGIRGEPTSMTAFADLVIEGCKEKGRFVVPPLIMLERQKNESGFKATSAVGSLALTKAEKHVRVPQLGIDWSNWGLYRSDDGKLQRSRLHFSELFTQSVARRQALPGYHGPIVHSRGAGAGQVTLPTLMEGISTKVGRKAISHGCSWVSGIPLSVDNETVMVPSHWNGAVGSIQSSKVVLMKKFKKGTSKRECTFDRVEGGVKYDCGRCLARFDLGQEKDFVQQGPQSYACTVDASRWPELFGEALGGGSDARSEFPCSWLRAVQLYAGSGPRSYRRILETSREIVALTQASSSEETDKQKVLRSAIERARRQL